MDTSRCTSWALIGTALLATFFSPPALAKNDIKSLTGDESGDEGNALSWTCEWDKAKDVTYTWDLGDGTTVVDSTSDGESTISHTYADDGDFDVVCLAETDDGKHDDQAALTVAVDNVDPALSATGDQACEVGTACALSLTVTDPGTDDTHSFSASLPDGAVLDGSAQTVTWTPTPDQVGEHDVTLEVTDDDGGGDDLDWTFTVAITDSDGDGLSDAWETEHGLDPDDPSDGEADPDGDGRTNLEEQTGGTDPLSDDSPSEPTPWSPADGEEWQGTVLELVLQNAESPAGDDLWLTVELFTNSTMTDLIVASEPLSQDPSGLTGWEPGLTLTENTWVYWWALAQDDYTSSNWSAPVGFFVNTVNDPPGTPNLRSPLDGSTVDTLPPELALDATSDPDGDPLTYTVVLTALDGDELSRASGLHADERGVAWLVDQELAEDTEYCWHAWATDDEGLAGTSSDPACFLVDLDNLAPSAPTILWPEQDDRVWRLAPEIGIENGVDPEGRYTQHTFELDHDPGFDSPDRVVASVTSGDDGTTLYVPSVALLDDTTWYLRVTCSDGAAASEAATVSFFVNSENDPPSTPALHNPAEGAAVIDGDTFSVINSTDSDGEELVYELRFTSMDSGEIVAEAVVVEDPSGTTSWTPDGFDEGLYIWTVRAVDSKDLASSWTTPRGFEAVTASATSSGGATPLSFWGCSSSDRSPTGAALVLWVLGALTTRRRR